MIATVKKLIDKYGCDLSLSDGSFSWRAFVEPLRYKNKLYVEESSLPEGMINRTAFRYIGPPDVDLNSIAPRGTVIKMGNIKVTVSHSEEVSFDNNTVYIYAVLNFYNREEAA